MAFSFPFFKKKPEKHVYFGFYFTESRIMGFAFDLDGSKANILSQNAYDVTAGYDKMLEDTDNLISDLESKTKLPLDKTIFFLHSILLDEETREIRDPYKETLKNISKELELEPMGYIDVHESIEGNMKENSVINNVLLEVSPNKLAIFVYKGGIMTASHTISRTDSVAADLESALKSLPGNIIVPSKIIMYGVGDMAAISGEIAQYKWDEKVFVQHPIIEVLQDVSLYQILADTFVEELLDHETLDSKEEAVATKAVVPVTDNSSLPFGFAATAGAALVPKTAPAQKAVSAEPIFAEAASSDESEVKEKNNWLASVIGSFSAKPAKNKKGSFAFGIIAVCIILLLAGGFMGYEYFMHAVAVEVKVPTEELSKKLDLTIPVVEAASNDLSLVKHTKVIEYDDEKSTTGKRDVGEKAKGDVILHNFDNSEKTVERGTELKTGNLIFILDSDVKIASSSGISSDGVKQSGKQKASVTAKDIGPEYNISKGTQLKIGSLSDSLYIAIADAAFTGGTKKQITTISKSDMDTLKKTVEAEVKKQAEDEVNKLVEAKDDILSDLTSIDVKDTNYSGEVGEEAKKISIKASSEINYYTVEKQQMQKKLSELLSKEKKEGFSISGKDITYKVDEATISKSGDEVEISLEASTKQFKEVDLDKIKNAITFKTVSSVVASVPSNFNVDQVTITSSSKTLPFASAWLPLFKKNISIKTTY